MRNGNGSGRVMVPLHGGMGFGSEAIRERGVSKARRSALEAEERRMVAAGVPLVPTAWMAGQGGAVGGVAGDVAGGARVSATRVTPASSLPSSREEAREDALIVDRKPGASARPLRTQPVGSAAMTQVPVHGGATAIAGWNAASNTSPGAVPSHAATPTTALQGAVRGGLDVGRARVLCGVFLDVVVLGCIAVLSALLTFARGGGLFGERLLAAVDAATAGAIAPHLPGVRFQWAGFVLEAGLTAAALLFLCQFLSVSFFHSTLGRFVVGVELAPDQRSLFHRVATATAEVVSAGGIFALPFVLLTPKRMPIFAWLRLVRGA